jgi:hypothetical protein
VAEPLKGATISAAAAIVAALVTVGGQVLTAEDAAPPGVAAPSPPLVRDVASPRPPSCLELIREVRRLPHEDPRLARELSAPGDSRLPRLWNERTIRRCGGADPERVLELGPRSEGAGSGRGRP